MTFMAEMEARRLVLSLREMLVRHDENEKAHVLLERCVPYLCESDPEIRRARSDQAMMVAHLSDDEAYAHYYAANVHERRFEDQYGIEPSQAHEHIARVAILRAELERESARTLLDLGCNDGWMAANLREAFPDLYVAGIDLNPDCVTRAREREIPGTMFNTGQIDACEPGGYDVVVCFEAIEHVRDPDQTLRAMVQACRPGGRLVISTPNGAVERGELPRWWEVEPKGHVRVYTPQSFSRLLSRHGTLSEVLLGPDGVLVACVRAPQPEEYASPAPVRESVRG